MKVLVTAVVIEKNFLKFFWKFHCSILWKNICSTHCSNVFSVQQYKSSSHGYCSYVHTSKTQSNNMQKHMLTSWAELNYQMTFQTLQFHVSVLLSLFSMLLPSILPFHCLQFYTDPSSTFSINTQSKSKMTEAHEWWNPLSAKYKRY